MRRTIHALALMIAFAAMAQAALADVKIKSRQTVAGSSYENTTFIKGKRQRTESMNGAMISLTQCDLRRSVQLSSATKTYMISMYDQSPAGETRPASAVTDKDGVVRAGGVVTMTVTTKDTGERKQMFGFTARRLIVTMETDSSPDACSPTKSKMETDGWYIDAEFVLDCDFGGYQSYNYSGKNGGCRDKFETKRIGSAKMGYPVYQKMTMFDQDGKVTTTMVSEVIELSKATLDAALFEIPADYREVSDASQMYAAAAEPSVTAASALGKQSQSGTSQILNNAANAAPSTSAAVGPKKEGTVRIGLAGVKTGNVGEGISAADLATAVQNTLISYLKVPNIEVVNLDAKLNSAIEAEARQKDCDYIIVATASHKKGGGGFGGMFGSTLASAVGRVGIGHTGSAIGNVAGHIATQAIVSAGSVSVTMKSKDELSLDVKMTRADNGSQAFAKVYKAKAKSDGQDIISQVIEQAAQAIVDSIGK